VYAAPAIGADGTIYMASNDQILFAVSSTGNQVWALLTGNASNSPAIGSDGTIYAGADLSSTTGNGFYAASANGVLQWAFANASGDVDNSSPAIDAKGVIYVGSIDNYLYAFNSDGTIAWKYLTGDEVNSSPAIGADGTIYVGSNDGYLYAIQ